MLEICNKHINVTKETTPFIWDALLTIYNFNANYKDYSKSKLIEEMDKIKRVVVKTSEEINNLMSSEVGDFRPYNGTEDEWLKSGSNRINLDMNSDTSFDISYSELWAENENRTALYCIGVKECSVNELINLIKVD